MRDAESRSADAPSAIHRAGAPPAELLEASGKRAADEGGPRYADADEDRAWVVERLRGAGLGVR